METLYKVLGVIGAILIVFILYQTVKNKPELFSKENLSKSFSSMGILGLILIVFVAFLIFMVRQG